MPAPRRWQDVLSAAGYPAEVMVIDFETYYDASMYSLKQMSIVEYVNDSRFFVNGVGIQVLGRLPCFEFHHATVAKRLNMIKKWAGDSYENVTVVALNAKFDCYILKKVFGIAPKYVVDLIDLDKMWDARRKHNMKALTEYWECPFKKLDLSWASGYRSRDMSFDQQKEYKEYALRDIDIESWLFTHMLPVVVSRPEIELATANITLDMFLNDAFSVDTEKCQEIINGMEAEIGNAIAAVNNAGIRYAPLERGAINKPGTRKYGVRFTEWLEAGGTGEMPPVRGSAREVTAKDISSDNAFADLVGSRLGPDETMPMKAGKRKMIYALSKDDDGTKYLLCHENPDVRLLMEARQATQSWPLHIAKVKNILAQAKAAGGTIGSPLGYHNAHTGRWGGCEGINLQNLGGRGRAGIGTPKLIRDVRGVLRAPDGSLLGIHDYSKVEAVGLAWQADQKDLLRAFASGTDVYSELATELFGFPVHNPSKLDPKPIRDRLAICRGFGKDAILGCGYGMGSAKFQERCMANPELRAKFDDGTFDSEFIERVIRTYRLKYAMIPAYWRTVEAAWRFATKYKVRQSLHRQQLEFWHDSGSTFIRLPSGRTLRYPNARVGADDTLAYRYGALWGGSLTENIIQALCRDLIAESLIRLRDNGFKCILTVHDEIVTLLKEDTAEESLKEMGRLMCVTHDWASGFPLSSEGSVSKTYAK